MVQGWWGAAAEEHPERARHASSTRGDPIKSGEEATEALEKSLDPAFRVPATSAVDRRAPVSFPPDCFCRLSVAVATLVFPEASARVRAAQTAWASSSPSPKIATARVSPIEFMARPSPSKLPSSVAMTRAAEKLVVMKHSVGGGFAVGITLSASIETSTSAGEARGAERESGAGPVRASLAVTSLVSRRWGVPSSPTPLRERPQAATRQTHHVGKREHA